MTLRPCKFLGYYFFLFLTRLKNIFSDCLTLQWQMGANCESKTGFYSTDRHLYYCRIILSVWVAQCMRMLYITVVSTTGMGKWGVLSKYGSESDFVDRLFIILFVLSSFSADHFQLSKTELMQGREEINDLWALSQPSITTVSLI